MNSFLSSCGTSICRDNFRVYQPMHKKSYFIEQIHDSEISNTATNQNAKNNIRVPVIRKQHKEKQRQQRQQRKCQRIRENK